MIALAWTAGLAIGFVIGVYCGYKWTMDKVKEKLPGHVERALADHKP